MIASHVFVRRFVSALCCLAALGAAGCSGAGTPVAPIRANPEPASPLPSSTASPAASTAPSASPTAAATVTPAPVRSATPAPTASAAPTSTAVAAQGTPCATVASGAVSGTGYVLFTSDGNPSGFQRVQIENGAAVNASPATVFCTTYSFSSAVNDAYSIASSDGVHGIVTGTGLNGTSKGYYYARAFANAAAAVPVVGTSLDLSTTTSEPYSSVVLPDTGDEAVTDFTFGSAYTLAVISGVKSGNIVHAQDIPTAGTALGLALASDGRTLAVRSNSYAGAAGVGITIVRVDPATPKAGTLGGTVAHTFAQTATFAEGSPGATTYLGSGGRAGLAADPADATKMAVVGNDGVNGSGSPSLQLLTGLPGAPQIGIPVDFSAATAVNAVTVSRDGKYAFAATNAGIVTVSGVDTGTLALVGTPYVPATAADITSTSSLTTTVDGAFLVALTYTGKTNTVGGMPFYGELIVMPIGANGSLGAPVLIDDSVSGGHGDDMLAF